MKNRADKDDIYDFGVILLELLVGRVLKSKGEIDDIMDQARPFNRRGSSHLDCHADFLHSCIDSESSADAVNDSS